jgi:T5SS/PEP-CTERM-associated repeat protein
MSRQNHRLAWAGLASGLIIVGLSCAASAEDFTTNIVDGVDATGTPEIVGDTGSCNYLEVRNRGRAWADFVGNAAGADSNSVLVTGTGSYLTNFTLFLGYSGARNRLVVTNGAVMETGGFSRIGFDTNAAGNTLLVSGAGSWWTNAGGMVLGWAGPTNRVTVSAGARLANMGLVAIGAYSDGNSMVVTDIGSQWDCGNLMYIGFRGVGNSLSIRDGGRVVVPWVILGGDAGAANELRVDGGTLEVTNGNATLEARRGRLVLENGTVRAGSLAVLSTNGSVVFHSGLLSLSNALIRNGAPFVVGDGSRPATLELLGGSNRLSAGLVIPPGAQLIGHGFIEGAVTNHGLLAPSPTTGGLLLRDPLVLQADGETRFDLGPGARGFVGVSNQVFFDGALRVSLISGFVPASTEAFMLMQFQAGSGAFSNAPSGARLLTTDGTGSFRVDYAGSALRLSDFQAGDSDGDGINDQWALQYFGRTPLAEGFGADDRNGDKDGDGATNYAEYVAGTNPTNAASLFRLTILAGQDDQTVTLEFDSAEGITHEVWYASDLLNWTLIASPAFTVPRPGVCQWTDDGSQTGTPPDTTPGGRRFYRVSAIR